MSYPRDSTERVSREISKLWNRAKLLVPFFEKATSRTRRDAELLLTMLLVIISAVAGHFATRVTRAVEKEENLLAIYVTVQIAYVFLPFS